LCAMNVPRVVLISTCVTVCVMKTARGVTCRWTAGTVEMNSHVVRIYSTIKAV